MKKIFVVVIIVGIVAAGLWIDNRLQTRNQRAEDQGATLQDKSLGGKPVKTDAIESEVTGNEILTVFGDQAQSITLLHGFLFGITYKAGGNYAYAASYAASLGAKTWRLANINGVYEFVVKEANLPSRQGTMITYVVQDVFHSVYGYYVHVNAQCPSDKKNCFKTYDDFKTAWIAVVEKLMQTSRSNNLVIDYYDVFGEPTSGGTKLDGLKSAQLMEIFKITHDLIRKYEPNAKIVGPSLVAYSAVDLKSFLSFVASNSLRLDAISWHELGRAELVPGRTQEIRNYIASNPKLCTPSCPEIHINEYGAPRAHLIPGEATLWLYYLEKAGVDQANKACWDTESPDKWSDCWAGLEGVLLSDNATPQPLYWIYNSYSKLAARVKTDTKDIRTAAVAGIDKKKNEMRILAGKFRFDGTGTTENIKIAVTGYPFGGSLASVEISKIPSYNNVPTAMPTLAVARTLSIRVTNGSFAVPIDNFKDGEAYSIVIRPE